MSNRNTKSTKSVNSTSATAKAASAVVTPTTSVTYRFLSPKGKLFTTDNISKLSLRFNLDRSAMSRVARGERLSHKNWRSGSV